MALPWRPEEGSVRPSRRGEVALWHFLEERGLSMESDLAQTKANLTEALERVVLIY